jgi:hypothetical protein
MRQKLRKVLIIVSFLSFPVIMNFLSPYVIIAVAAGPVFWAPGEQRSLHQVREVYEGMPDEP